MKFSAKDSLEYSFRNLELKLYSVIEQYVVKVPRFTSLSFSALHILLSVDLFIFRQVAFRTSPRRRRCR